MAGSNPKVRDAWFHTNPSLFELPSIQRGIADIWRKKFKGDFNPAKDWSKAVRETQSFLINMRKEVQKIRENRRARKYARLQALELLALEGNPEF